ncbi:conserved hypothetical protein [Talaromyces stipitatus ATCC 10500]|uniref:Ribosomal protein S35, mitochondrial n=1 Tax=Talaromyces stipitatus (strain ATCC 10500 / CBS 375.48 / QM 6759 / NRRL 1006) TaxID=441959 RepID=B8MD70_TALSN|nr:uncharacterized protein TSTA_114090 [Talaromyces stipitatus ATCC 10500]EED17595.1 conserved hypothetical protein [Talaromyces stipitatus ATCC 10500]
MPPRIKTNRILSSSILPSSSSTLITSHNTSQIQCSARRHLSSSRVAQTRLREQMFDWLNGPGASLKHHIPGSTNYVTALRNRRGGDSEASSTRDNADSEDGYQSKQPFPLNPLFVSEPILSDELSNEIYKRVVVQGKSVRSVSVELRVDMRRVGAVVRLKELEKRMKNEGKSMAVPYARAVHEMVPTTPLAEQGESQPTHESINDLPVHRLTAPQIFYPVSESRQFTRVDAGRVFSAAPALEQGEEATVNVESLIVPQPRRYEKVGKGDEEQQVLLPADARIPHPQLIALERDKISHSMERREYLERYQERLKQSDELEKERKRIAKEKAEKQLTRLQPDNSRFEFRFKDVVVSKETTGPDGRGHVAPGRRYGVPTYDRKKGQVKIPQKVEV